MLEYQLDTARKTLSHSAQDLGRAQHHGCMHIVAAGVHNPRILTGIRQSGFLLHGQCVDIAAQCHATARASGSMDQRYNGGWYRPFDCINPVFLQLLSNQGRCPYLVSSNLRMAVNIPANLYHLREIFLRSFFYRTRLKFPPSCMASGSHCLFSMVSMFAKQT